MRDKNGAFLEEEVIKLIKGENTEFIKERYISCSGGHIDKYMHPFEFPIDTNNPFGAKKLRVYILANCNMQQATQHITGDNIIYVPDTIRNLGLGTKFTIVTE